ncbi:MAG: hypothetical protein EBV77_10340 [Gemmatimonadaceae bacterium]|nr:hypothetical protein [Gemmatimonadaceae bacterium]
MMNYLIGRQGESKLKPINHLSKRRIFKLIPKIIIIIITIKMIVEDLLTIDVFIITNVTIGHNNGHLI